MKIFISWSGSSKSVAIALRDWLPAVIQQVEPWVSSEDLRKGSQWLPELTRELNDTSEGIVCLTADNLESQWLNYEAGALAKKTGTTKVRTALSGLGPSQVTGPLSEFQHTVLGDRADVRKLLDSINESCSPPLSRERLDRAFDKEWPDLVSALKALPQPVVVPETKKREMPEMVEEILEIVRGITRLSNIEESVTELRGLLAGRTVPRIEYDAMKAMISSMVDSGLVRDSDLEDLKTNQTSMSFDQWVDGLVVTNPFPPPPVADDHWGSPPPAGGSYSDEPPF